MHTLQQGYRAIGLLLVVNSDRLMTAGAIVAALLAATYVMATFGVLSGF